MRTQRTMLLRLLATLALVACDGAREDPTTPVEKSLATEASDDSSGAPVAKVQDLVVGSREFELAAAREVPANGLEFSEEERRAILDELIVDKMLFLEAKKQGIDKNPKVQKVMVNTLLRDEVYSTVRNSDFTSEELHAYFDQHKEEFVVPEKLQIRRIFVKAGSARSDEQALALARQLHAKVVASPDDFKTVAEEHSEDPYRRRGGDIGFISRDGKPGIDPEVVEKAFSMEIGQISQPFLAGDGYHILQIANRRDRIERTFEQMKGSVLRRVKNDRYKELYEDYVEQLRRRYELSVDSNALSGVRLKPSRHISLAPGKRLIPHPPEDEIDDEPEER